MNTLTRVILSWASSAVAVWLTVMDMLRGGNFGDPRVFVPLAVAYLLRYTVPPSIARERAPSRRWLIIPAGLFAAHMIIPIDLALFGTIAFSVVWMVRDDISIYRHRAHGHTTA